MAVIHLLCVGKLQDENLRRLEQEYLKRLTLYSLQIHEIRSASTKEQEGQEVCKKIYQLTDKAAVYLLAEQGKNFADSETFAFFLHDLCQQGPTPIFVLGGARGHGASVMALGRTSLSLSPLTFPHQWARVLLIEQMYRAQCIQIRHPYHRH